MTAVGRYHAMYGNAERKRVAFRALVKSAAAGMAFDDACKAFEAANADLYPQGLDADVRLKLLRFIETFKG